MQGKNAKRWRLLAPAAAFALLLGIVLANTAIAGDVGTHSGFEDDDGNLAVNSTFDWNGFSPVTWTGSAPYRVASKTASGWQFGGAEDAQAVTSDTGFAGGTKQDLDCPTVIGAKAPNKDDLKRIYLSSKTVAVSGVDHVFLNLAWVRIPQNTTSPSAHVAFEFNKGTTACGGAGGLVKRSEGDMLIVYDFEGGATDTPQLTLRRWALSGSCEISSDSAPCWGPATNLTALGYAEAKVNTTTGVVDAIAPGGSDNLGVNEFGEAGIDLTAAGVFTAGNCTSFGKADGVSRSSGNSGTAQMKDLVGPLNFELKNCGTVTIIKQTNPRGLNQSFPFTSDLAGAQMSCTADTSPASFNLNDSGNTGKTLGSTDAAQNSSGNTETCTNVPAGSYTVTEGADPTGFAFGSLTCSSTGTGSSTSTSGKVASITLAGGGTATCVYVNNQQLGAIKISKTSVKGNAPLQGATFSIKNSGGTGISGSPFTTDANGEICVDNLAFGTYKVQETAAPDGYAIDDSTSHDVTVDNNAKCSDATYVGESISFSDTPLSQIQVKFTSLAGAGVTKAQIVCSASGSALDAVSENGAADATPPKYDDTDETFTNLDPGVYTCTIDVDP
jgi:hypothetical protein